MFNSQPLLEPRGFIRILQIFLAILTFSLVCGYSGEIKIPVNEGEWIVKVSYPFPSKLETGRSNSSTIRVHMVPCGVQGSAEFVVALGVISMLLCIFALAVYLFKTDLYEVNHLVPLIDLALTALLTFMWFIAACAWASAASALKSATSPEELVSLIGGCVDSVPNCILRIKSLSLSSLQAAVAFAFLNIFVWVGSCWFVYKDTRLHKGASETLPIDSTQPPVLPRN